MAAKKKKKKKKPQKMREVEFDLNFSDITMVESEGHFDRVKAALEKSHQQEGWKNRYLANFTKIADAIGPHDWNVKTVVTITSPFGIGRVDIDLKSDGSIYIVDYAPSGNPMTAPDLSALMRWSQSTGWKIPQPTPPLIRTNVQFWRYMWETLIIDSDYLDERFGTRKSLDMREIPKTPMELAEEEEELEGLSETTKAHRRAAWQDRLDVIKPQEEEK